MPTGVSYRDAMLRHQILLERVKGYYYRDFNTALKKVEAEVRRIMANAPSQMADLKPAARRKLIREVKEAQERILAEWVQSFIARNKDLMKVDRKLAAAILEATQIEGAAKLSANGFLNRAPNIEDLWADILAAPIGANGQTMEEMLQNYIDYSTRKVSDEIAKAIVNETSSAATVRAIVGPKGQNEGLFRLLRANSRALIATVMQHTSTSAHRAVQSSSFETYRWVSVLDTRTTEICRSRHNKIFQYSTGPKPPAHFHCRSTIAPNVPGAEEDMLSDGDEWLARQLASTVTAMLGADIGDLRVADLMEKAATRPMTIAKLGQSADIITRPN